MAQAAPGGGKLVLKPGVIHGFLENFGRSSDKESFYFTDVNCTG